MPFEARQLSGLAAPLLMAYIGSVFPPFKVGMYIINALATHSTGGHMSLQSMVRCGASPIEATRIWYAAAQRFADPGPVLKEIALRTCPPYRGQFARPRPGDPPPIPHAVLQKRQIAVDHMVTLLHSRGTRARRAAYEILRGAGAPVPRYHAFQPDDADLEPLRVLIRGS